MSLLPLKRKCSTPSRGSPYEATTMELLSEAGIMILAAAGIYFLGPKNSNMPIFIAVLLVARFMVLYQRGDLVVFLLGVLLGGGNDVISMWRGVYYYTAPTVLPVPIPVWMVIFWGEAFLFFRRMMRYGPFLNATNLYLPRVDLPFALDMLLLVLFRTIIYRFAAVAWLPDMLFAVILLLRYLVLPPAPHERRLLLTILVLGPLYEIALISAGLYVYTNGIIFGMPVWLIVYWMFVFRLLKALMDRFEQYLAVRE